MHKMAKWHLSIYLALACFGVMAFTASPTIASFVVHFGLSPILLTAIIFAARFEGRHG